MCDVEYIAEEAARRAVHRLNNAVEENEKLKIRVRELEADLKRRKSPVENALTNAWARAVVEGPKPPDGR